MATWPSLCRDRQGAPCWGGLFAAVDFPIRLTQCNPVSPLPGTGSAEQSLAKCAQRCLGRKAEDHDAHLLQRPLGWTSVCPSLATVHTSLRECGPRLECAACSLPTSGLSLGVTLGRQAQKGGHVQAYSYTEVKRLTVRPRHTHTHSGLQKKKGDPKRSKGKGPKER